MRHEEKVLNRLRIGRAGLWALAFSAATALLRTPFLRLPFDRNDEGYYATVAQAAAHGARVYADLWFVRPPLLNTTYEWAYRMSLATGAPFDAVVRVASGLAACATVGVIAWLLFEELPVGPAFVGSALAALAGASLALQNEANAETLMMLPYALSGVIVLRVALRAPPPRRAALILALAGAFVGLAAGFKQVAFVELALPAVAWLAFDRQHVRRWLGYSAAYVGGALLTWLGTLAHIAFRDDIRAFFYFAWARNLEYMSASHTRIDTLRLLLARLEGPIAAFTVAGLVALGLLGMTLLVRGVPNTERRITLFAFGWLALSAIGISASGRYYPHYFIQATVPLALLLAASAGALRGALAEKRLANISLAGAMAIALAMPMVSWGVDVSSAGPIYAARDAYRSLGKRLARITPHDGDILVWGISASVRAYCPLPHATRLPVACYNYGWSPVSRGSFLGEQFPSTADVVLADLRRNPPDTVILTAPLKAPDAEALEEGDDGVKLTWALWLMVNRDYEFKERGPGYVVLTRKPNVAAAAGRVMHS